MVNVKSNKKQNKNKKIKISLIIFSLNYAIFKIIEIIIFFIFKLKAKKFKDKEIIKIISPNEIMYKGSIILKTKLLKDYFSRISIAQQNQDNERNVLNKFLNLSEYSNVPNEKNKYKNQFLNYFSEKKKKKNE